MPELQEFLDGLQDKPENERETSLVNFLKDREIGKSIIGKEIETKVNNLVEESAKKEADRLFKENIGEEMKKTHTLWENTISQLTGIQRKDGEKGYDVFAPRAIEEYKNKVSSEAKGATFDSELNAALEKATSAKNEEISNLKNQLRNTKIDIAFNSDYNQLNLKGLNELEQAGVKMKIAEIKQKATISEDGKIVFLGEDGKQLRNESDYSAKTPLDMMKEAFKGLEKDGSVSGGGSKGTSKKKSNGSYSSELSQTQALEAFEKSLAERGITKTSDPTKYKAKIIEFVSSEDFATRKL